MSLSILHCNSMAVNALVKGNYTEAHSMLRNALQELKIIQQQENENESIPEPSATAASLGLDIGSALIPGGSSLAVKSQGCAAEVFAFFNRALVIRLRDSSGFCLSSSPTPTPLPRDNEFIGRIALVLLYNMGLTYHLMALDHCHPQDEPHRAMTTSALVGNKASAHLTMALSFYKNAMAIASTTLQLVDRDAMPILALFNNMGWVHAHFVDHKSAEGCLEMLTYCFEAADCLIVLTEDECLFFYVTTFVFPSWQLRIAPAA